MRENKLKKEYPLLEDLLLNTNTNVPQRVKRVVLSSLYDIKREFKEDYKEGKIKDSKRCGALIVVGFSDEYDKYIKSLGQKSDIVNRKYNVIRSKNIAKNLLKYAIINTDGAILIDAEGNLLHTGYRLTKFFPEDVADSMSLPEAESESKRYGFREDVGTRHIFSIAFSYIAGDTLVYTMSEESSDPKIRVFAKGNIVVSPYKRELENMKKRPDYLNLGRS